MFLILPNGCQYGSDRCYCHCVLWCFEGLFLTDKQLLCYYGRSYCQCGRCYCHLLIDVYLADVIAKVLADVIAKPFMADVIAICGWCWCHYWLLLYWLMLLPMWWLMFLPYVADGIATLYVMGWCYCPVADGIATWLKYGQMLFGQCGRWNEPLSQLF